MKYVVLVMVLTVASGCLIGAAQAAKPNIRVGQKGLSLRVTFVAPVTTDMNTRYFVRVETARQEGCAWKSTGGGRGGRAGQAVLLVLSPNSRQGRSFCAGPSRVTVFLQKAQGGLVAKDASAATFKLVGRVSYEVQP